MNSLEMVLYDAYKQFDPGSAAKARALELLEISTFYKRQCYDAGMQSPQVNIKHPNFLFLRKFKSPEYGFLKETILKQYTSRASVKTLRKLPNTERRV